MQANEQFGFGSHGELVQLAVDLMSEVSESESWLRRYDAALESGDDMDLVEFCWGAWRSIREKAARSGAPVEISQHTLATTQETVTMTRSAA